jgi:arylsulfatase A-like enzyme
MTSRILFLTCMLFGIQLFAADKPNVIVILADDQGWGDLSMNGNKDLSTPNIDSIAKDGARFEYFYVSPVCSPTRAEFLTGRYNARSSIYSTSAGGERMDLDEKTIADTFKAAGYATAAFGKWHNGMQFPYHPNARGFQEYYGFCSGHWGHYFSPMLEHNNKIVKGNGYITDDLTNRAMDFIEANKGKAFFVYLPYCTPHSPMQVPDKYWDKHKDNELLMAHQGPETHTRSALAMCENIDDNVGRLLKKLDDLKLSDNTIVLYFSDNGPNGHRWNKGLKGVKGSIDEGGVLSPLVMRWPGIIKKGTVVEPICGSIDLLPTLADFCGIPLLENKPLDGISMKQAIVSEAANWPDRHILTQWKSRSSIRNQQYRMDDERNLYDIHKDPQQKVDLSKELPDVRKAMMAQLKSMLADVNEGAIKSPDADDRPFIITHPDSEFSQIPARDASYTKGIKRSNQFPNCSYLMNWTSIDDYIYWDAEVAAAGEYDATVYYTCLEGDTGAELELSFGKAKKTAIVTKINDPAIIGAEEDRHKRVESYVKDFKPLSLGIIKLERGIGRLKLRALSKPGNSIIEFRLLTLRRIK